MKGVCRALCFAGVSLLCGCAGGGLGGALGGGRATVEIDSAERGTALRPAWATAIYHAPDANTADMILSDLPREQLIELIEGGASAGEVEGSILRVRMFLHPHAGRTPIEQTASNASATLVVLARGRWGVYGGGAFMIPSARAGAERISGSIDGGTMRLTGSSAGFEDVLGACDLTGRVAAQRDDAEASRIAAWVGMLAGGDMS